MPCPLFIGSADTCLAATAISNSNLAREAGRLYSWEDKIWSRRYQAIIVSGEEEAQTVRLKYVRAKTAPIASRAGRLPRPRLRLLLLGLRGQESLSAGQSVA
jgi:hypothetical protein